MSSVGESEKNFLNVVNVGKESCMERDFWCQHTGENVHGRHGPAWSWKA